jgi:hypothetical protein
MTDSCGAAAAERRLSQSALRRKVDSVVAEPLDASPRQAAEALAEIAGLRRRTRRSLGMPWFPLVCFGALTMLSAPAVAVAGVGALAPFWAVAGAGGMLLTRRHYRHRSRRRGAAGRRRAWTVAGAMFAGGFAAGVGAGVAAGETAGVLAPIAVVLAGYAVFGWLQRSLSPALAVAPGAAVAAALALADVSPWVIELTFGAALVAAGVSLREMGGS